jgi:glycosyltransferase involved in cell wall biosynthesis
VRIVQILPELDEGGVERGVVELSRELVLGGFESVVISAGGRQAGAIEDDGGTHIRLDVASKNPLTALQRARALRKVLKELRPDLIHARSRVPAWLSVLANRSLHIPFVTTVHGFNSVSPYSRVMTYGDRVICVSSAIRAYVQKHYGVPDDKLVVIPRGVDLQAFDPNYLDRAFMDEFKVRHGLERKFVITSVGRITQLKDYETLLRAVALARKDVPNLCCLIVGGVRKDKDVYFSSLQKLVKEQQAGDYIHFTGNQSKISEIYALSDVVISSSKKPESFGRSAAEALAMEVPVIATGHGGILDIVLEGRTGYLFPPGNAEVLAAKIVAIRGKKLEGLRSFVMEHFSLRQMVEKTLVVYREQTGG